MEAATISVSTASSCSWTATSNNSWITITSGSGGSGNGTVSYSVTANSSSARTGTITVAGLTFTVNQAAGTVCNYAITPTSRSHNAAASTGVVSVQTSTGCSWTAASNVPWSAIFSGSSGSGNGDASYSVATNASSSSRIGTLTIAGQTFTVTQAGSAPTCTYSINPTSRSHTPSGGPGIVSVSTSTGCSWTASSNVAWVAITAGGSGTGNGDVSYSVGANAAAASRNGTLTLAGQTFAITQAGAASSCSYAIFPSSRAHGASAGTGIVSVSTATGCTWTAVSNTVWITISAGASGNGNGDVTYSITPNGNSSSRSGTLTVAGQTFSVTQAGASQTCTYSILPGSRSHGPGAETGTIAVTAPSGCTWVATTSAGPFGTPSSSFVSITSGSSGTGNGTVTYSIGNNPTTTSRTATLIVAGQTFTITQAGTSLNCYYLISPSGRSHGAGIESGNIVITVANGCNWTATSNVPWITITSGSSGSGNGTVTYTLSANTTGASRTGTMTVAGQTFTVTQTIATGTPAASTVLVPLATKLNPSIRAINASLITSLALLYPPVGGDPLSQPGETLSIQAKNADGTVQEDTVGAIYPGQQVGLHADGLLGLPNLRNVPAPAALEALSEANLKGFFLVYSDQQFRNMDGVGSEFQSGKKIVLSGLRYKKDLASGVVSRQTHVFVYNPNPQEVSVVLTRFSSPGIGFLESISTPSLSLKRNAALFASIDTLFPSLRSEVPGFELSPTTFLVAEGPAELRAMLVFENAQDSISTAKGVIAQLTPQEDTASSRTLFAPFVTLSRTAARPAIDRFDTFVTLYNGDPTNEAVVTFKAFSTSGLPLFSTQPQVETRINPGSQLSIPLIKRGPVAGLFSDEIDAFGPDPLIGYLEIIVSRRLTSFGLRGALNVHGYVSVKFAGANETIIPLTSAGLAEAYFLHVAHQVPGQGPFRTALAILNPTETATTLKVEVFETNSAATDTDRAKLGRPTYVGRINVAGRQQLTRFIDQLVNEAQPVSGEPKPFFTSQLGGYIRLTSENPAVQLMTFCTYFSVDESAGFVINSLSSIDAQSVQK